MVLNAKFENNRQVDAYIYALETKNCALLTQTKIIKKHVFFGPYREDIIHF